MAVERLITTGRESGPKGRLTRLPFSQVTHFDLYQPTLLPCHSISFLYLLLHASMKLHLIPSICSGFQPVSRTVSVPIHHHLKVCPAVGSSSHCSVTLNILHWIPFLALSLAVVVQYLLSPYNQTSVEATGPCPATISFWKSAILSA